MKAPRERLAQGRSSLLCSHPFFAIPSMKYPSEFTEAEETAATDGRKFFFNPKYILGLSMDELKTLIAHEVLHILLKHHLRRGNRNLKLWNYACDYVVNAILVKADFRLKAGMLYEAEYEGMTPEQVYAKLHRPPPPEAPPQKSDEPESQGDQPGEEDEPDASQDGEQEGEDGEESQDGEGKPGEEGGDEPGEPGDQPGEGEESEENKPSGSEGSPEEASGEQGQDEGEAADLSQFEGVPDFGSVLDYAGEDGGPPTEEDLDRAEAETDVLAVQAAQYAEAQAGSIPGELKRAIEEAMHPELPWWRLLERFMVASSSHGSTWVRPNRRFIASGIRMPARQSRDLDEVVVMIDTSGSISNETLNLFAFHVNAIIGLHPSTVHVVYFDSIVQYVQEFESGDTIELEAKGGGGTDYRPPFEWVRENDVQPTCILVLTDGWCDSFHEDPGIPVLWVLEKPNRYFSPQYGETIEMEE